MYCSFESVLILPAPTRINEEPVLQLHYASELVVGCDFAFLQGVFARAMGRHNNQLDDNATESSNNLTE